MRRVRRARLTYRPLHHPRRLAWPPSGAPRTLPNITHQFDETGRALREEEKKRIAVTVKLHMAGLSSVEWYVHAQYEQGKQMGRAGDACGDFYLRRLRVARVELCSGGEASGRCSGLPRPQKLGHGSSGPHWRVFHGAAIRVPCLRACVERGCRTGLPPNPSLVVHSRKKVRFTPCVPKPLGRNKHCRLPNFM